MVIFFADNPVKDLFGLISNLANGGPPIDFAKQVLNFGNKYVKDFDSTELPDALKWGISYLEGNSDMSGLTKKITDWLTSAIADLIFENNGRKKRDLSDSIENMVSSVIKIPFRIIAFILKLLGLPLRMLCSAGA